MAKDQVFDVLVIGSGAAGLTLALDVADGARVAILSKGKIDAGATAWAQGGIAAVFSDEDSFEAHIADTIDAGAGLCDESAVRSAIEHAPAAINWLIDQNPSGQKSRRKKHLYILRLEGILHDGVLCFAVHIPRFVLATIT